jgi:hypothetical protein
MIEFQSFISRASRRCRALLLSLALLAPAVAGAADWIYSTRPGDNIWDLTEQHLKSIGYWKRLQRYNAIENPRSIRPGTRLRIPIRWLKVQPASAEIAVLRGDVRRRSADAAAPVPAAVGDELKSGDSVITAADASATLRFADGSLLLVHAGSRLVLDSMSAYGTTGMVDTRMRLDRGRLENRVTPAAGSASRYQIITPSAVVAVRGTEFRAAYVEAEGVARSEVIEGAVAVSAERRARQVPAGFGLVAKAGEPLSQVVALLPAPDLSALSARLERILVEVDWPALEEAVAYRVQIFEPGTPASLLLDTRIEDDRIEFDAPQDGEYLLRVRGIDAAGLEGVDAQRAVTVNARPVPPRRLGPADAADLLDSDPTELWWSRPEGVQRFRLQVAEAGSLQAPRVDLRLDGDTRHTLSEPLPPGRYQWRLRASRPTASRGPSAMRARSGCSRCPLRPVPPARWRTDASA